MTSSAKQKPQDPKDSKKVEPTARPINAPRRAHNVRRVIYSSDKPTMAKGSFAQECDINRIVDQYTQTGMVNHLPRLQPQYGDAPDQTFFEAACIATEAASALLDNPDIGKEPKTAPEASEADSGQAAGMAVPEGENPPEKAPESAPLTNEGT